MRGPVELWTSPLRGPARALRAVWTARGPRSRVAHRLPTLSRLSPTSPTGRLTTRNYQEKETGQPLCSKTGQVYLLLTAAAVGMPGVAEQLRGRGSLDHVAGRT